MPRLFAWNNAYVRSGKSLLSLMNKKEIDQWMNIIQVIHNLKKFRVHNFLTRRRKRKSGIIIIHILLLHIIFYIIHSSHFIVPYDEVPGTGTWYRYFIIIDQVPYTVPLPLETLPIVSRLWYYLLVLLKNYYFFLLLFLIDMKLWLIIGNNKKTKSSSSI